MKAILEFDIPEDGARHIVAVHALDWALVVEGIDAILRDALKYGHKWKGVNEALSAIRDHLAEEMYDRGVSLDMME